MKLTPSMTHYFMSSLFNDLRQELDPYIVDIDMTLVQGEKILVKFALDREFDATISIHENIVLSFQHFVISRDKMIVSKPIFVDYELLPVGINRMILPNGNILCVMPGDPIIQVVSLIKAFDQEREEILKLLKFTYISRRRLFKN